MQPIPQSDPCDDEFHAAGNKGCCLFVPEPHSSLRTPREPGGKETIEGGASYLNSGADIQFDPVNRLFLIEQQICAGQESASCIQIYDTQGNWVETTNVIPGGFGHIAFNPNTRTGFLWLNDDDKFDGLESFTY